jgi:hypothetical protein
VLASGALLFLDLDGDDVAGVTMQAMTSMMSLLVHVTLLVSPLHTRSQMSSLMTKLTEMALKLKLERFWYL